MKNGLCRVYDIETDSYPCKNERISPDRDGPFGFCEVHAESFANWREKQLNEIRQGIDQYRLSKGV